MQAENLHHSHHLAGLIFQIKPTHRTLFNAHFIVFQIKPAINKSTMATLLTLDSSSSPSTRSYHTEASSHSLKDFIKTLKETPKLIVLDIGIYACTAS